MLWSVETTERTRPPLGQMLVAKGLVREDELVRALAEHERTGRPVGEILVSRGAISAAALTEALLLQNAWRPLGQLLVERGLITDEDLEQALGEQEDTGRPLGEIVRTRFHLSAADLGEVIAEQHELELELERGFGSGLRRGIDARRPQRRDDADEPVADDALLLTRLRPAAPSPAGVERIATLQAALEAREETIAALGSANRRRTLETETLRRELADRDRVIDELRRRLEELEGGSGSPRNVVPLNPR
jgi:hypothetical protein